MKDKLVGALITLIVTIVAGIAVYYFSIRLKHEPDENLIYEIDPPISFTSEKTKLTLITVRLFNRGDARATNVKGAIDLRQINGQPKDIAVTASTGDASGLTTDFTKEKNLIITLPVLLSGEAISVSFFYSEIVSGNALISLKSDKTIARSSAEYLSASPKDKVTQEKAERVLYLSVPVLLIVQLVILFVLRRLRSTKQYDSSLGNSAFLLLHRELVPQAKKHLEKAIHNGEGDAFSFSNYAVCLAYGGDFEGARHYLEAASFCSSGKHAEGVVEFNRGIVYALESKFDLALKAFKMAVQASSKEVLKYAKFSVFLKKILTGRDEFESFLKGENFNAV